MSNGLPLLARCQPSIFDCKVSRSANSSRFLGARSRIMAASPAQNASGEIPVFGVASLAMKSNKTGAIFSPWASIRFIIRLSITLSQEAAVTRCFRGKNEERRKGGVQGPFSAKAGALRRPFTGPVCANNGRALAQILAARSTSSSNRMPLPASIRSISSVASVTERVEVSIVNSLLVGGW